MKPPIEGTEFRRWLEDARPTNQSSASQGHDAALLLAGMAENGIVTRTQAMRRHAFDLGVSVQQDDAPPADERHRQDADLFECFSNAYSAVACTFVWAFAHACRLAPDLPLEAALTSYPADMYFAFETCWPESSVTRTMREITRDSTFFKIGALRNALDHRGAPGRLISISIGAGRPQPPRIPMRGIGKLPDGSLPDWELSEQNLQSIIDWVETAVGRLVSTVEGDWLKPPDPTPQAVNARARRIQQRSLERLATQVDKIASTLDRDSRAAGAAFDAVQALRQAKRLLD